jgi:hypothetical protein
VATVSLGLLGQVEQDRTDLRPTPAAQAPATAGPTLRTTSRAAAARPAPTRPPIGEDGVMGGLVFGTAFGWLDPGRTNPIDAADR